VQDATGKLVYPDLESLNRHGQQPLSSGQGRFVPTGLQKAGRIKPYDPVDRFALHGLRKRIREVLQTRRQIAFVADYRFPADVWRQLLSMFLLIM